MNRLRVTLNPCKEFGWGHLPWFYKFIEELKNYFYIDVNEIPYQHRVEEFKTLAYLNGTYNEKDHITDTDMIIEDYRTNEIIVISFTESIANGLYRFANNPSLRELYYPHYNKVRLDFPELNQCIRKNVIKPFYGLDLFNEYNTYNYTNHRINYDPYISDSKKLFFRGNGVRSDNAHRITIAILEDNYKEKFNELLYIQYDEYLTELKRSKLALAFAKDINVPYIDVCHRDMDYAMIGIPFIAIEYQNEFLVNLEPDKHYISIPYADAHDIFKKKKHNGVAELIMKKYDEVINNNELLLEISKNLRRWFDNYASPDKMIELTLQNSALKDWMK